MCAHGSKPIRPLPRQPSIAFDLASEQPNLRNALDPLPLVTRCAQQIANDRKISIYGRRSIAALELPLSDAPDDIAVDIAQHQLSHVTIKAPTDSPTVRKLRRCVLLERYRTTASCHEC